MLFRSDLTTANVAELTNLYYTNARVYSNVIGLFAPYETKVNVALKANIVDLTTSNVAEGNQLYFTNARAVSAVTSTTLSSLNVSGNVTAHYFFGDGSLLSNISAVGYTGNTSGIAEGENLYYTNARVYSNVIGLFAPFETKTNVALKANIVDLTTSNVVEGSQLYYTNARVYSNVIGLFAPYETKANVALKANIVDLTTSNVVEIGRAHV